MESRPASAELLAELYERSAVVDELDGPQVEAWTSGLFAVFDEDATAEAFVDYCKAKGSKTGRRLCAAIAELAQGLDSDLSAHAGQAGGDVALVLGGSTLVGAWRFDAPFGTSIVLAYNGPALEGSSDLGEPAVVDPDLVADDEEDTRGRHAILVEVGTDGTVEDLQLAGPAKHLIDEAAAADDRVTIAEITTADAVSLVVKGWPSVENARELGPGFEANQQFVRRRLLLASGQVLPAVHAVVDAVDVQRGLSDEEYAEANRASLSTLRAAVGDIDPSVPTDSAIRDMWIGVVQGDVGDLSPRERDGLLWLEWADWLGVGIGALRAGTEVTATGAAFVDFVNRCPEVSSTIDKADRDYAEWAFEVALDLLDDVGAVEDGRLTAAGSAALGPALVQAWQG